MPDISGDQVGTLLQVLQQLWQEQRVPEAQRVTAFSHTYQLLARWALGQFATATTPVDKTQLHEAVTGALRLLQSHGCTAQVSAACILFLGAASKGKMRYLPHLLEEVPADALLLTTQRYCT